MSAEATLSTEGEKKKITLAELQAHNHKDDLYVLIHGKGTEQAPFMSSDV